MTESDVSIEQVSIKQVSIKQHTVEFDLVTRRTTALCNYFFTNFSPVVDVVGFAT